MTHMMYAGNSSLVLIYLIPSLDLKKIEKITLIRYLFFYLTLYMDTWTFFSFSCTVLKTNNVNKEYTFW